MFLDSECMNCVYNVDLDGPVCQLLYTHSVLVVEYILNAIHYEEPRSVSCRYAHVSNASPNAQSICSSSLEICTTKAHQQSICFTLRSHKYCTKFPQQMHINNGSTTETTITEQQQKVNDMTSTKTTTIMI